MKETIIALGTNFQEDASIERIKSLLQETFPNIQFTKSVRTRNVGESIYGKYFTNALAKFHSDMVFETLDTTLKQIEKECGDKRELRTRGIVKADIDILTHNGCKHHLADWERKYIKQLINEL